MADELVDELKKLAELHGSGVLNDAEFTAAKERLLSRQEDAGGDDASAVGGTAPDSGTQHAPATTQTPDDSKTPMAPKSAAVEAPDADPTTQRAGLKPIQVAIASVVGLAIILVWVVAVGGSDEPGQNSTTASPRISSEMTGCNLSTTDGTITGAVAVTNHSSQSVEVQASLLFHHEGTRVGDGSSFTTLRPKETAELAIIGGTSRWPSWYGEADGYVCTHEARVVG